MKRAIRQRIKILEAIRVRRGIQKKDEMLRNRHPRRFAKPKSSGPCMMLRVEGNIITKKEELLQAWAKHFHTLGKSKITDHLDVEDIQSNMVEMERHSFNNEDFMLDIPVQVEEIEGAIKSLPNDKAASFDGVMSEHLKFGGESLNIWIVQIFNAIISLKCIPASFKKANITPVYKGKGRDTPNPNSYRGIGVSTVLSKLIESILLPQLLPELEDTGFPSVIQTYQHGVSCEDATFSVYETVSHFVRNGNTVLQTFYEFSTVLSTAFF